MALQQIYSENFVPQSKFLSKIFHGFHHNIIADTLKNQCLINFFYYRFDA